MTATLPALMTAEEFAQLPNPVDGSKQELVNGRIRQMPPPKGRHGRLQTWLAWTLMNHVEPNRLGWVVTESGVILQTNPDTVRGPDVAFYSIARQPQLPDDYFEIPPDLAIEILSPDDRKAAVRENVRCGVALVWLVDPDAKTVTVYTGSMRGLEYDETDTLDGGTVLPQFRCPVADLFQ